jgi:KEOPS complex subunit Pcc1
MPPPHEAVFRITTRNARVIARALEPELSDEVNPRSKTACSLEGEDILVLRITADDLPALRAALNMALRLASVAGEISDLV